MILEAVPEYLTVELLGKHEISGCYERWKSTNWRYETWQRATPLPPVRLVFVGSGDKGQEVTIHSTPEMWLANRGRLSYLTQENPTFSSYLDKPHRLERMIPPDIFD